MIINEDEKTLHIGGREIPLYSQEAFEHLSNLWLKVGWQLHYHYTFSWLGVPALQLPEDLIRIQELIVDFRPDFVIEIGVAMGGSLLFYASVCQLMESGHVIGIDKALRPHNKERLEKSRQASYLSLIEGDSQDLKTVESLSEKTKTAKRLVLILDSNHSSTHVKKELELYAPLVPMGSYILVADGFKERLHNVPRGKKEWEHDHPLVAIREFLSKNKNFELCAPTKNYDKNKASYTVTHFQEGWLKRIS